MDSAAKPRAEKPTFWTDYVSNSPSPYTNRSDDMTTDDYRLGAAYHEAGHAVLMVIFEYPIDHATIAPSDETGGHVSGDSTYQHLQGWQFYDPCTVLSNRADRPPNWPGRLSEYLQVLEQQKPATPPTWLVSLASYLLELHYRDLAENNIIVLMAGEITQQKYVPDAAIDSEQNDGDREWIDNLLECLAGGDQELQRRWRVLLEYRTGQLVDQYEFEIRAVADALLAKTTLTGAEVAALVKARRYQPDSTG